MRGREVVRAKLALTHSCLVFVSCLGVYADEAGRDTCATGETYERVQQAENTMMNSN